MHSFMLSKSSIGLLPEDFKEFLLADWTLASPSGVEYGFASVWVHTYRQTREFKGHRQHELSGTLLITDRRSREDGLLTNGVVQRPFYNYVATLPQLRYWTWQEIEEYERWYLGG